VKSLIIKYKNYLIFLVLLILLITLKIINPSFIKSISFISFDLYQKTFTLKKDDSNVVIIDIDEESLGKFGQFPWNRTVFAKIIENVDSSKPKSIAFDVFFAERDKQSPEEIISALFGYGSFNENSVNNSSLALYYFALGLPAFALIKVFSSFFFANHDTKTPFYISLISVMLNILISVGYFSEIGFIIIPIATSISSWFNSILLFLFLKNRQLFYFNQIFFIKFIKIIFASIMMGLFFNFMLNYFQNELAFNQSIKSFYLVLSVILGLLFYLIVCYFIKAFQMNDIKLRY